MVETKALPQHFV